jgi:hypothetical protein
MRNGSMVRGAAGFRLVLALALALLGFAFTHVFVSGSRAAEVTTTIPKPDPPPTTSAQRTVPPPAPPPPQPQTQPVVPQPPPSPAPSPRPASPPPAVPTPPAATVDGATQRPVRVRRVRKQTARHLSELVHASAHIRLPRSNAEREAAAVRAAGPLVPDATPRASSNLMALLLAIAIGLPLIAVGTALMPAWALPQFVLSVVDKRRGDIVFAGIAVLLSGGVGLLIARVVN